MAVLSPARSATVGGRMFSAVASSGSGAHDDFPGRGTKTAFGLPIRIIAVLALTPSFDEINAAPKFWLC